jgi:hypothetical protein
MIDKDFCDFLEYQLSKSLFNSSDKHLKAFWCDGIILPLNENEYSKKSINDNRQVLVSAYFGKDGQDEYSMLIRFGSRSLSRYARGLDIKECVPSIEENDWYIIDEENKTITIQLL